VIPGTTISVSFAHRGRQGNDVVGVEVGPVGGPYTSLGNFTDGNTAWALHTVNYTIPTGSGTNYTLRFVSVSSTGGNPSIGNLLDAISISSLGCPSQPATGVVSVQNLPDPTVTVTQPTCALPSGSIVVTSPLNGSGSGSPANLFISEVTDAAAGSLTYVELYNGTGADIDLSNYKLKVYNYGTNPANPVNLSCDLALSGMIANNTTKVIKVSSSAEAPGITPDLVFAGCGGVNNNDYIKLTTSADVDVDLWGMTDGSAYTPSGAAGYTYRRLNTATVPSTTWNAAEWTALDPEDYSNVGQYTLSTNTYEYSLDGGTYTSSTTYAGLAPGVHTITVHDLVTGCYSLPFSVTIDPIVATITTTFTNVTICNGDAVAFPATSLEGVTGTWNPSTIDNTTTTTYAFTPDAGQCASTASWTVTVNQKVTPTFAAVAAICNGDALSALPTTSLNGYTGTWSPALDNTATTTYTFTPTAGQCATTATLTITVNQKVLPTFTPVATICSGEVLSALPTTSLNGYTGTWSPALNNTATTTYTFTPGIGQCATAATMTITVTPKATPTFTAIAPLCFGETTVPSLPTVSNEGITGTWTPSTISTTATDTYNFIPDAPQCSNTGSLTVTILDVVSVGVIGDCQNNAYVLTVSPTTGTFDPSATYTWENGSSEVVGTNAPTLTVTTAGTYTVSVNLNGCISTANIAVTAEDIACTIQKGISADGDGLNDNFDLSGFNVKKITIFNRYGMEVYSKTDYTNQWKGESNDGDKLPDGTYFYVFSRDNGETRSGWIYINREN
jgi:gliding motility-associated-like protein